MRRGLGVGAARVDTSIDRELDVSALVRELRDIYHGSGIDLMLRIGGLILERLYGGDVAKWQSRRRKDVSFRKLEKHPDLPFKAAMLSRAVSIYVLSQRRPDLCRLENVSQTHLQEVLPLSPDLQDRLLRRVVEEKWSVRRLRKEVADTLPAPATRGGRHRVPSLSRQLRLLQGIADGRLLVVHASNVATLRLREAQELLEVARRLCHQAEEAARVLTAHLESIDATCAEVVPAPTRTGHVSVLSSPDAWSSKRLLPTNH
jgi:hypothetical protein